MHSDVVFWTNHRSDFTAFNIISCLPQLSPPSLSLSPSGISPVGLFAPLKRRVPPTDVSSHHFLYLLPPPLASLFLRRVMEWLRHVDLSEYAPNLRGSGVHGALLVMEKRCSFMLVLPSVASYLVDACRYFMCDFNLLFSSGSQLNCLPHFSPFLVPNPFLGNQCLPFKVNV